MSEAAEPLNHQGPSVVSTGAGESDHRAAVVAGFLGWTLDAFDFFIVIMCKPAIAKALHVSESQIALSISLTLFMRPLGAFIFGLMADRYGRRRPLMINLVFYSAMSVLSGLAPTFGLFLTCRILFGIGMGGEWGVGASLAMEKVPVRWRGLLSGLLQEGYAVGYLLASIAYFTIFPKHGYAPLFLLGGLPALLALFVRSHVGESAAWERSKQQSWGDLGSALLSHWRPFLAILSVMIVMNLASHGTQDMFPSLLKAEFHLSDQWIAIVTGFSCIGMICGGVTVGLLSDRIGRRRAMVLAFLLAIGAIYPWAYGRNLPVLMVGAFLIQFMVQGAWGVIPAHITELSPDSVRGFLPGFGYQCAVALAGFIGYFQDLLRARLSLANAMALTAVSVFVIAAVVIGVGKERRGVSFGTGEAG